MNPGIFIGGPLNGESCARIDISRSSFTATAPAALGNIDVEYRRMLYIIAQGFEFAFFVHGVSDDEAEYRAGEFISTKHPEMRVRHRSPIGVGALAGVLKDSLR